MAKMMKTPDVYDGSNSWSSYIEYYTRVSEVNGWNDKEKTLWLLVSMTGQASSAVQRLSEEDKQSFDDVRKKLTEIFQPKAKQNLYKAQFRNKSMIENQDLSEFATQLKLMCDLAHPVLDQAAKDELVLEKFIDGIKPKEIAFQVMSQNCRNLEEALSLAVQYETIDKLKRSSTTQPQKKHVDVINKQDTENTVQTLQLQVQALSCGQRRIEEKLDQMQLWNQQGGLQNDAWPETNAVQWDDGRRATSNRQGRPFDHQFTNRWSNYRAGAPRQGIQCFNCGAFGHFARDCRNTNRSVNGRGNSQRWFR